MSFVSYFFFFFFVFLLCISLDISNNFSVSHSFIFSSLFFLCAKNVLILSPSSIRLFFFVSIFLTKYSLFNYCRLSFTSLQYNSRMYVDFQAMLHTREEAFLRVLFFIIQQFFFARSKLDRSRISSKNMNSFPFQEFFSLFISLVVIAKKNNYTRQKSYQSKTKRFFCQKICRNKNIFRERFLESDARLNFHGRVDEIESKRDVVFWFWSLAFQKVAPLTTEKKLQQDTRIIDLITQQFSHFFPPLHPKLMNAQCFSIIWIKN